MLQKITGPEQSNVFLFVITLGSVSAKVLWQQELNCVPQLAGFMTFIARELLFKKKLLFIVKGTGPFDNCRSLFDFEFEFVNEAAYRWYTENRQLPASLKSGSKI